MDVMEKLVELLGEVQETGVNEIPAGFGFTSKYITNEIVAAHLISHGVTVQEWIPVTERLPKNIANRVLVVCERSNGVFYAHYEKPFWINLETDKPFISTVTHWMPLPSTEGLK